LRFEHSAGECHNKTAFVESGFRMINPIPEQNRDTANPSLRGGSKRRGTIMRELFAREYLKDFTPLRPRFAPAIPPKRPVRKVIDC
jgi:hypothetical protein